MNITALYDDYHRRSGDLQQINQFVAASLLYIIKNYFSQSSNYLVLTMCCHKKTTCDFYKDMLHKMFVEWQEWPLQIVVVDQENFRKVPGMREYNLIFTDSYKSLEATQIHTYVEESNLNEYFFIFLQTRDDLHDTEIKKIFNYCWQHYLINTIIGVQKANGQVLIYTYYPFTPKFCGHAEVFLINEFNGTSLVNEELFPKKLKNFYGCPIKAVLYDSPPFLSVKGEGKNATITGGIEGKILLELAKKLNFSIDILPSLTERGEVLNDGSVTGSLTLLQNRQADICLGSFRQTAKRCLVTSCSLSYFQTVYSIVTLSEAYVLTSWETITFPFTVFTWYLIGSMIVLFMGIVAIQKWIFYQKYQHRRHVDHIFLDVFLIAMGMSAQYTPTNNTSRIIQITWIMFSLIVKTIYQALLYHLIRTHVRRNVPESLEDVVQQNYSLVADTMNIDALVEVPLFNSTNFIALEAEDDFETLIYLEQQPLYRSKRMAGLLLIVYYKFYTDTMNKAGLFKVLPKSVMNFKMCMYFTKHSYLINQFDRILILFNDCGLLNTWYRKEIDDDYVSSKHIVTNHMLDLKQLHMAFVLLLIGYFIAAMVFMLELIYKRFLSHGKFLQKFRRGNGVCVRKFRKVNKN